MPKLKFRPLSLSREEYTLIAHYVRGAHLRFIEGAGVSDEVAKRKAQLSLVKKLYYKFHRNRLLEHAGAEVFELRLELKELREVEKAARQAIALLTTKIVPGYMDRVDRAPNADERARLKRYLTKSTKLMDTVWPSILKKVESAQ